MPKSHVRRILWLTSLRLAERGLAVGRHWIRRAGVGRESARAAHLVLDFVSRSECRVRAHSEPLEREERACHLEVCVEGSETCSFITLFFITSFLC